MTDKYKNFDIRLIRPEEAGQGIEIEQICFPPNEACSPAHMQERIDAAPGLFLVAVDRTNEKLVGILTGISTDEESFRDEFFTDISLYEPEGKTIMLLSLAVLPDYRKQGLARELMKVYVRRAKEQGRKKLILTCLNDRVPMYEKFGFIDDGISSSSWGGEKWHAMIYRL